MAGKDQPLFSFTVKPKSGMMRVIGLGVVGLACSAAVEELLRRRDWQGAYELALQVSTNAHNPPEERAIACSLAGWAMTRLVTQWPGLALPIASQGLKLAESSTVAGAADRARGILGILTVHAGLCLEGESILTRYLQTATRPSPADEGKAHQGLGYCAHVRGDRSSAIVHYRLALDALGDADDIESLRTAAAIRLNLAGKLADEGLVLDARGELVKVQGFENSIVAPEWLRPLRMVTEARIYLAEGKPDEARKLALTGLQTGRDVGDVSSQRDALTLLIALGDEDVELYRQQAEDLGPR